MNDGDIEIDVLLREELGLLTREDAMSYARGIFEDLVKVLDICGIEWWVREGWSLRKLPGDQIHMAAPSRQRELFSGSDEAPEENDGNVGGRGQELLAGDGRGSPEGQRSGREAHLVKKALARRPKAPRRARRRRR